MNAAQAVLQPRSLREDLVHHLQHDILTGVFQPGQRIVEREVCVRFGVSSIPVREALQHLEGRGLLVHRVNHGYSVVQLEFEEARRICELRRVLEPPVVEWATARVTPEGLASLERQLDEMEAAARSGDMSEFFLTDLQFHRLLWRAAGNPYAAKALEASLCSLFAAGLARNEQNTRAGSAVPIDRLAEVRKHRSMLRAIRTGDGKQAAKELLAIATGFERQFKPEKGSSK